MLEILPHLQKQSEYHRKMVYNMHLKLKPNGAGVREIIENYELVGITNIWLTIVSLS